MVAADGCVRYDLDHTGAQCHARQRIAGQVVVERKCKQTIRRDQAATTFGHFLVRVKHQNVCAKVTTGRAGIDYAECCIIILDVNYASRLVRIAEIPVPAYSDSPLARVQSPMRANPMLLTRRKSRPA